MTQTVSSRFDDLRAAMSGEVVAPEDPGYDTARVVYNAEIDRRPAVIARCCSAADVSVALGWAVRNAMAVSVRGGGHNFAGSAVVDDAMMIDLSLMREVSVDLETRRARARGGALLSDLDGAAQAHGLVVPAGIIGHTGVGGLALGGGMGWLSRRHGLSADNLVSAEVVLADGQIVRASADEHPDLFWALRGGGGNFGVVTEFEFALHPLHPTIEFALLFWPLGQGRDMLRVARDVLTDMPEDLNILTVALNAPPEPFVPEPYRFQPGYAMMITGFGADVSARHASLVSQIKDTLPPLFDMATPMPYVALQQMFDEANPFGAYWYERAAYITELSEPVIDIVTEYVPRKTSPLSLVFFYPLDAQYCAVGEDETAFGSGRSPRIAVFVIGKTDEMADLPAERAWVRDFHAGLAPVAIGREVYVNALIETDDDQRVRDLYGSKYERLSRIKATYDPGNMFRANANIKPA